MAWSAMTKHRTVCERDGAASRGDLCTVKRRHVPRAAGSAGRDTQRAGQGRTRPLGIPTVADRLLQRAVARILEAVFEADFLDCSYGFRPGRNPLCRAPGRAGPGQAGDVRFPGVDTLLHHQEGRYRLPTRAQDTEKANESQAPGDHSASAVASGMWKARRHFRVFFGRHQRRVDRGAPLIQETIERISARTDTPQNDLVESRFTETTTCPGNNEDNDDEAAVVPERSAQATTRLVAADVRLHRRPPVIAGGLCQAMRPRSVMSRRYRSRCVGSVPDGHLTAEFISDVTR